MKSQKHKERQKVQKDPLLLQMYVAVWINILQGQKSKYQWTTQAITAFTLKVHSSRKAPDVPAAVFLTIVLDHKNCWDYIL